MHSTPRLFYVHLFRMWNPCNCIVFVHLFSHCTWKLPQNMWSNLLKGTRKNRWNCSFIFFFTFRWKIWIDQEIVHLLCQCKVGNEAEGFLSVVLLEFRFILFYFMLNLPLNKSQCRETVCIVETQPEKEYWKEKEREEKSKECWTILPSGKQVAMNSVHRKR